MAAYRQLRCSTLPGKPLPAGGSARDGGSDRPRRLRGLLDDRLGSWDVGELVATSSRGEVIGVDPVELLAEPGDLGLVRVGDGGVEREGRRPDEVEQFVGGADRSARL